MTNFYAYKGQEPLGQEPLGTSDKLLFKLKTNRGALAFCKRYLGNDFSLYSYTNFYDSNTFQKIGINK